MQNLVVTEIVINSENYKCNSILLVNGNVVEVTKSLRFNNTELICETHSVYNYDYGDIQKLYIMLDRNNIKYCYAYCYKCIRDKCENKVSINSDMIYKIKSIGEYISNLEDLSKVIRLFTHKIDEIKK